MEPVVDISKVRSGRFTIAANSKTWCDFGAACFAIQLKYAVPALVSDPDAIVMQRHDILLLIHDTPTEFRFTTTNRRSEFGLPKFLVVSRATFSVNHEEDNHG